MLYCYHRVQVPSSWTLERKRLHSRDLRIAGRLLDCNRVKSLDYQRATVMTLGSGYFSVRPAESLGTRLRIHDLNIISLRYSARYQRSRLGSDAPGCLHHPVYKFIPQLSVTILPTAIRLHCHTFTAPGFFAKSARFQGLCITTNDPK